MNPSSTAGPPRSPRRAGSLSGVSPPTTLTNGRPATSGPSACVRLRSTTTSSPDQTDSQNCWSAPLPRSRYWVIDATQPTSSSRTMTNPRGLSCMIGTSASVVASPTV